MPATKDRTPLPNLPHDFLTGPPPGPISVFPLDFAKTPLPEYKGLYAVVLDNCLSAKECEALIAAAEANAGPEGWERAMVNVGGGRQELDVDTRNCGRIIWDSHALAARIWNRIENLKEVKEIASLYKVPAIFGKGPAKFGETWTFTRPNEKLRFLKYQGGEYFRPHCDGVYETPDGKERSYFTLHLYLNSGPTEDELATMTRKQRLEATKMAPIGGATTFHAYDMSRHYDVQPTTGRILIFQHRDLVHSGADVLRGVKYTMRTDLMYTLTSSEIKRENGKMVNLESKPMEEEPWFASS